MTRAEHEAYEARDRAAGIALAWWWLSQRRRGVSEKKIRQRLLFDHGMRCMEVACGWRYGVHDEPCRGGWPR